MASFRWIEAEWDVLSRLSLVPLNAHNAKHGLGTGHSSRLWSSNSSLKAQLWEFFYNILCRWTSAATSSNQDHRQRHQLRLLLLDKKMKPPPPPPPPPSMPPPYFRPPSLGGAGKGGRYNPLLVRSRFSSKKGGDVNYCPRSVDDESSQRESCAFIGGSFFSLSIWAIKY